MTTKTTQFTPGPWALEYDVDGIPLTIIGNDGSAIGTIETWNDHAEGNRHIITAAPAMYEALQQLAHVEQLRKQAVTENDYVDLVLADSKLQQLTQAVLAQAEGRHHE